MRIGSLFSGGGMLDCAVEQVFGGHTVWHCETDPAASKVLNAHRPGVPNYGDVKKVTWGIWREHTVDVLCGGFPCQDISVAGRLAGMGTGTRSGLWSEFARAVKILRPRWVVIENVRNLLSVEANRTVEYPGAAMGDATGGFVLRGLGAVLGDLSDLGYDAQWCTVAASDVGAPHERKRVFILATDACRDRRGGYAQRDGEPHQPGFAASQRGDATRRGITATVGHGPVGLLPTPRATRGGSNTETVDLLPTPTGRDGKGTNQRGDDTCLTGALRTNGAMDHPRTSAVLLPTPSASEGGGTHPDRRKGHTSQLVDYALLHGSPQWGKYEPAIRRWEQLTRPAPSPTEPNTKGNPRLAAAFSEWMMGWPAGWVTGVPGISRNDQLRIIGNGVVTIQAVAALRWLLNVCECAA